MAVSVLLGAKVMGSWVSCLGIILLCWLALNLIVRLITSLMHMRWIKTVEWIDGSIMSYAEPFEEGKGEVAILFIHGFNDLPYLWRRFTNRLAQKGFYCRAMRLPGAGEISPSPSLEAMRRAIDDECSRLCKSYRKVIFVGHSMGGALALDAALRYADNGDGENTIDRLVLLAPLIEVSMVRFPLLSARAAYRLVRLFLPMLKWVPSLFREWLSAEDDSDFVYRRDHFIEVGAYKALFELVSDLHCADRNLLTIPTQVYVAENDRVVDSNATLEWFDGHESSRTLVVPNASHVIPLGIHWETIADTIVTQ